MSTPRDTPEARTLAEPADPKAQPREPGTVFEIEIDTDTLETRFQRFPLAAPPAASGERPTEIEIEQAMEATHDRLNGEGAFEELDLSARITMLRTVAHLLDAQPTDRLAGGRAPAQTGEPEGCTCQGCGRRFKMDLLVDNATWNVLRPEGKAEGAGLLCPSCIVAGVEKINGFSAFALVPASEPAPSAGEQP